MHRAAKAGKGIEMDWNAILIGAGILAVFLLLVRIAGKHFHATEQRLKNAAQALREERHRMIDERHHRDQDGNYVHGDPVWGKP